MTQNEMIKAIQQTVVEHQFNHAAKIAAKMPEGLEAAAIEAMRIAFRDALIKIFQKSYDN